MSMPVFLGGALLESGNESVLMHGSWRDEDEAPL
jgi:hypothetical protein